MNEAETRAELIDPPLAVAGWGVVAGSRARREMIAPGRLIGGGKRETDKNADYVLTHRGRRLAVIEAKSDETPVAEGVGQAKDYADRLRCRFAYAANGRDIYRVDMATGAEGSAAAWPTPDDLWAACFPAPDRWRDAFAAVPWATKGGTKAPYYYQQNAAEAALDRIAAGGNRVLLTLATGTGKTAIALQIAHKLFGARWSLSNWRDEHGVARRPRILFLADRTGLADQALGQFAEYGVFEYAAMVRIDPAAIAKKGGVPKNASVFFTIFQTFMTEDGEATQRFTEYPPDFFDVVFVDECHRGGANDESTWRAILEHFAPAVQIGLTATPKRRDNVDTYAYFGDPAYSYSLKQGINDGFLTPFRVRQFATTLDDYVYTPDDIVVQGEPKQGHRYQPGEFNRTILIREREAKRVDLVLAEVSPIDKTIVFCATQEHAALIRDLINQRKSVADPNWCVRVTSCDGTIGDTWLRTFQDNDKTIPNVLTTSQKLSTGVDARNVRNIVLLRPVRSMIEFKQIIGRGTRLYEGKDHFTVLDFEKAYEHFEDPEWDGEPIEPVARPGAGGNDKEGDPPPPGEPTPPLDPPERVVIRLADGKDRMIQSMSATSFWSPGGRPMSAAEFIAELFGVLPELFRDEEELRALWGEPETRNRLLAELRARGYGQQSLQAIRHAVDADASDLFDVLLYIAQARPMETRAARAASRRDAVLEGYNGKLASFLDFVLGAYVDHDVGELDPAQLGSLIALKYGDVSAGARALGGVPPARAAFIAAQARLYASARQSEQ